MLKYAKTLNEINKRELRKNKFTHHLKYSTPLILIYLGHSIDFVVPLFWRRSHIHFSYRIYKIQTHR